MIKIKLFLNKKYNDIWIIFKDFNKSDKLVKFLRVYSIFESVLYIIHYFTTVFYTKNKNQFLSCKYNTFLIILSNLNRSIFSWSSKSLSLPIAEYTELLAYLHTIFYLQFSQQEIYTKNILIISLLLQVFLFSLSISIKSPYFRAI